VLVLAVAAVVGGVLLLVSVVSAGAGIITSDGTPGSAVVVAVEPGQTETVELEADTLYQLWVLGPSARYEPVSPYPGDECVPSAFGAFPAAVGPGGQEVRVRPATGRHEVTVSGHTANARWQLTTDVAGTYQIEAPEWCTSSSTLALVEGDGIWAMLGGIGLMVVLWIVAGFLGLAGLGMTLGGALWWSSRKKRARSQATPPPSATPVPPLHP